MHSFIPAMARLLLWPCWLIALGLWLKGAAQVGGGFSAGVLAALAVLLQYVVFGRDEARRYALVRHAAPAAFGGLLVMLGTVFGPALGGHAVLSHFPRPGAHATALGALDLHTGVLFEGGLMLVIFGLIVTVIDRIAEAALVEEEDAE